MSRCQSASDLDTVFHRLARGKGARAQALPQRLPFEQLLDGVGRILVCPKIVHRDDIGMVELACGARFLLEASQPVGVLGEGFWQHFDGDLATQPGVARAVHLAHPARTQRRYDFVRTEFSTGTEHSDLSLHSGISPARSRSAARPQNGSTSATSPAARGATIAYCPDESQPRHAFVC